MKLGSASLMLWLHALLESSSVANKRRNALAMVLYGIQCVNCCLQCRGRQSVSSLCNRLSQRPRKQRKSSMQNFQIEHRCPQRSSLTPQTSSGTRCKEHETSAVFLTLGCQVLLSSILVPLHTADSCGVAGRPVAAAHSIYMTSLFGPGTVKWLRCPHCNTFRACACCEQVIQPQRTSEVCDSTRVAPCSDICCLAAVPPAMLFQKHLCPQLDTFSVQRLL